MLHFSTVDPTALSVLRILSDMPGIHEKFALAGGTALALYLGHRVSIDLDLFCFERFLPDKLDQQLMSEFYPNYRVTGMNRSMLFCYLQGVKTDFVYDPTARLSEELVAESIRLLGLQDIAAMKLKAICGRGRRKDFFDIYALLQFYPWVDLLNWFGMKYGKDQYYLLWKSIQYFEEAENDPEITGLGKWQVPWNTVKEEILVKCA